MTSKSAEYASNDRTHPPISHTADAAHRLIEAFKSIVLPIARAYAPTTQRRDVPSGPGRTEQHDTNFVKYSSLAPEAQQLLSALEKFIIAIVANSKSAQHDIKKGDGAELPTEGVTLVSEVHVITDISPAPGEAHEYESSATVEDPQMLKLALNQARDRVFNKMPIRLLAFNSDGSGIHLLERSEILDCISSKIIAEFYMKYEPGDSFPWNVRATDTDFGVAVETIATTHGHYAILSHTWLHDKPGEVTYAHWTSGKFDVRSPGYQKLANFCRVAATTYGATFGWMDTICINKDSSAELDESIRSMYKWYKDAAVCIAYLSKTTHLQRMHKDTWFTRGWTLQEMLSPRRKIKFYGANWRPISGNHEDDTRNTLIVNQIQLATTMKPEELRRLPWMFPISRRMQWAANRHVIREEDAAYSLMGTFGVDMSIAYGEGSERAFVRLTKEILMSQSTNALDVVNWGSGPEYSISRATTSSLIPTSLKHYRYSIDSIRWPTRLISLTNLGLHLPVLIMRAVKSEETASANPIGNYYATVTISAATNSFLDSPSPAPSSERLINFNILDKANPMQSDSDRLVHYGNDFLQTFFGVLNFYQDTEHISLPSNNICFAVCLYSNGRFDVGNFQRIQTSKAISFPLLQVRERDGPIRKSELAKHGMQLVTMYL